MTYTASCNISAGATGSLVNTATVATSAGVTDPALGNNSATDTDTLVNVGSDLAITKTNGVGVVVAGSSTIYTITASNAGPTSANGAIVTDNFPASETCSWTCAPGGAASCTVSGNGNINQTVNLPVSGTVVYTATCAIAIGATGTVSNTATVAVAAGGSDPNLADNSSTDVDQLVGINLFANGFEGSAGIALMWMDTAKSGALHDSGLLWLPVGGDGSGLLAVAVAYSPMVQMRAHGGTLVAEIQGRRRDGRLEVRLLAIHGDGARTLSDWASVPRDVVMWTLEVSGAAAPGALDGRLVLSMDGTPRIIPSGLSKPRQPLASALLFGGDDGRPAGSPMRVAAAKRGTEARDEARDSRANRGTAKRGTEARRSAGPRSAGQSSRGKRGTVELFAREARDRSEARDSREARDRSAGSRSAGQSSRSAGQSSCLWQSKRGEARDSRVACGAVPDSPVA